MGTKRQQSGERSLGAVRRMVVKVGSAVIAGKGRLRPKIVAMLAQDVSALLHHGCEVVMVVSGSVASGFRSFGMKQMPADIVERQASASVGQPLLVASFSKAFARHRRTVAQLLMSADDIENRRRFISARHTLHMLMSHGVVPIINENDALSDHEAIVGDNDHLAAMVTNLVSADLLVILSRVPGVFGDDGATVIPQVEIGSPVEQHIRSTMSESGVGGMKAKISAARLASQWSVPTIIAEGAQPGILSRILLGEAVGTIFVPGSRKLPARKRWIAVRSRSLGSIIVDQGAAEAVRRRGASLLPSGIVRVDGKFPIGSRVDVVVDNGGVIAVGVVSYSSDEIQRIRGKRVSEIEKILGYVYVPEVVHRDDLVVV